MHIHYTLAPLACACAVVLAPGADALGSGPCGAGKPLPVVVVVDRSTSIAQDWGHVDRAIREIVGGLCDSRHEVAIVVLPGADRDRSASGGGACSGVNNTPAGPATTVDCARVSRIIARLAPARDPRNQLTPLASAIPVASQWFSARAPRFGTTKGILVWLTDGVATAVDRSSISFRNGRRQCDSPIEDPIADLSAAAGNGYPSLFRTFDGDDPTHRHLRRLLGASHALDRCRSAEADSSCLGLGTRGAQSVLKMIREVESVGQQRDVFHDIVAVGNEARFACTGVAIGPRAVLTARHCLPATRIHLGIDATTIDPSQLRRVIATHVPPTAADVALLEVDGTIPGPFRAWRGSPRDPDLSVRHPPGYVRTGGFGAQEITGRFGFGRLHTFDALLSGWGCASANADALGCEPGRDLVLFPSDGHDTCNGDSGGPLYELVSAAAQCRWRLAALVSRTLLGAAVNCGSGGIYTRTDAIAAWLNQILVEGDIDVPEPESGKGGLP